MRRIVISCKDGITAGTKCEFSPMHDSFI